MHKIKRTAKSKRGRPPSGTAGAPEAFDLIQRFMKENGFNIHSFAIRYNMTPSTVIRALNSREKAAWTPGFDAIYCIAKNKGHPRAVDLARLESYRGPGEEIVRRILVDVEDLVRTLSREA